MDHEYIADIVNAHHPGNGGWRLLPKMDHGFALHYSLNDSVAHEFVGPFGDATALLPRTGKRATLASTR